MPDASLTEREGRRVLVLRFLQEDVAESVAYCSHAEVACYQNWDALYLPARASAFIRQLMTAHPGYAREWFQFAVALRAIGQLIGECAATTRADDPRRSAIGFTIAPWHQGRGYARSVPLGRRPCGAGRLRNGRPACLSCGDLQSVVPPVMLPGEERSRLVDDKVVVSRNLPGPGSFSLIKPAREGRLAAVPWHSRDALVART